MEKKKKKKSFFFHYLFIRVVAALLFFEGPIIFYMDHTQEESSGSSESVSFEASESFLVPRSGQIEPRRASLNRKGAPSPVSKMVGLSKFGKVRNFLASPVPVRQRYSWNDGHGDSSHEELLKELLMLSPRSMKEKLLQHQKEDKLRSNILHEASLKQSVVLMNALLDIGISANTRDASGAAPLHWICRFVEDPASEESVEVLLLLLEQDHTNIDARDADGYTPLMYAVDQCNEEFVRVLISHGADVNCRSNSGTYPIIISVYHGTYRIAEMLFQAGANVDVAGEDGLTPLMIACRMDNLDVVVFLVKSGAVVDFKTKAGVAKDFSKNEFLTQFLTDSAFYQNHHKEKKRRAYNKMVDVYAGSTELGKMTKPEGQKPERMSSSGSLLPEERRKISLDGRKPSHEIKKEDGIKIFDSENYPLDLDYFAHPVLGKAQIGMCMCPGRNKPKKVHIWRRDLNTDLELIKDSGADILITLVKNAELLSMGIMELFVRARQLGLETLHFPVPDKWIPDSMSEVMMLISKILVWVKEGKKIVIHCNGGKGRTGMVAVATLVALGLSVDEGIRLIRTRRPGMIKNPAQIFYLKLFDKKWETEHPFSQLRKSSNIDKALEKDMVDDLRHERKQNMQTPKSIGLVTLTVNALAELNCTINLVAVSGQPPRFQKPISSETGRRFRFIVSDYSSWYALMVIRSKDSAIERTAVLKVKSVKDDSGRCHGEQLRCKIVAEEGAVTGELTMSYLLEVMDGASKQVKEAKPSSKDIKETRKEAKEAKKEAKKESKTPNK